MLDTTSYTDKLPFQLNEILKAFTGSECVMVRKIKDNDKRKIKNISASASGNCHLNVKAYIDKFGGKAQCGWLLSRVPKLLEREMYVWNFHSAWLTPDNKLLDVTNDKYYIGRDKTIFVADTQRVADIVEGLSYNNFIVFTNSNVVRQYGDAVDLPLELYKQYWCDNTLRRFIPIDEHTGVYRLINKEYTNNLKKMCEEYEVDIINGRPIPKPNSKYDVLGALPTQILFDYSLNSN